MKKVFLFASILMGLSSFAQEQNIEMADAMRSNGKIYVVVAVLLVILIGLIIYLINLDRKIAKLEKELKVNKQDSEENGSK